MERGFRGRCFQGHESLRFARPLWRFDVPRNRWSPCSPKEVGHRKGFYDYVGVGKLLEDETADGAFVELENKCPLACRKMASCGFARWDEHLELLLSFVQMMRARSLLFREFAVRAQPSPERGSRPI